MSSLTRFAWPAEDLGRAMAALARRCGMPLAPVNLPSHPFGDRGLDNALLFRWMDTAAEALGIDAEMVYVPYSEVRRMLRTAGPALFGYSTDGVHVYFLALLEGFGNKVRILGPDLRTHLVAREEVVRLFAFKLEYQVADQVDQLLARTGLSGKAAAKARIKIMNQQLRGQGLSMCWILRSPVTSSFLQQLKTAGLFANLLYFAGAYVVHYVLFLLGWQFLGQAVFGGHADGGLLVLWGFILLSQVPFSMLTTWHQGVFNLGAAAVLKRRLLLGALRLDPDKIRGKGPGALLGRVLESDALETLVLNGGFGAVLGCFDILAAFYVLYHGANPNLLLGAMGVFLLLLLLLCGHFYRRQRQWTLNRLGITAQLIERMVGHRTRIVQQKPERFHDGEDESMEDYVHASRRFDRQVLILRGLLGRSWVIAGLLLLVPQLMAGTSGPVLLGISLGGILLAAKGFTRVTDGITQLATAAIAWEQIGDMLRPQPADSGNAADRVGLLQERRPNRLVMQVRDLHFAYPNRDRKLLQGIDLDIHQGDRILLEGASGSGKSTLAAVLSGLRQGQAGLILLRGLDRQTMGEEAWRRFVAVSPQFHENHIFSGSLAFNLLLGGEWPAQQETLDRARELCEELGLGPLIQRMPAGMEQVVGDTGWQLSHGERGRLFIARALLTEADLVLLDESFASLDPQSLLHALRCVEKHAPALMVIAHP